LTACARAASSSVRGNRTGGKTASLSLGIAVSRITLYIHSNTLRIRNASVKDTPFLVIVDPGPRIVVHLFHRWLTRTDGTQI
jgi:hypothetical protein